MNKLRDTTFLKGRPCKSSKISIRYDDAQTRNGVRLHLTEIFPEEHLSIDWYGA